jgi:hypothetical protein
VDKSVQVPIMGEIYKAARQVLIWLGDGDNITRVTFDNFNVFLTLERRRTVDWVYKSLLRKEVDEEIIRDRLRTVSALASAAKYGLYLLSGKSHCEHFTSYLLKDSEV